MSRAERQHIEFLQRMLRVLDEALKPRHNPITPRDFQVTRQTSLTVTFGECKCDQ